MRTQTRASKLILLTCSESEAPNLANRLPEMAHFAANPASRFAASRAGREPEDEDEFDEEDEDSFSSSSRPNRHHGDKITRKYQTGADSSAGSSAFYQSDGTNQETIRVHLNESYFANERRQLVGLVANVRQKLNTLQMFNPAKNQTINEQQQNWNEKVSEKSSGISNAT